MSLKDHLNKYRFNTVLPGSGKEINYKGYSTNTIKELLMFEQEEDPLMEEGILDELIKLSVTDKGLDIDSMYVADRYYLLVKIREATKGSEYQFQYKCPNCNSQLLRSIDLNDMIVKKPEKIEEKLYILNDNLIFTMNHPTRKKQKEMYSVIDKNESNTRKRIDMSLAFLASHVIKIESPDGEENTDPAELIEFIGELPESELKKFRDWQEKNGFGLNLEQEISCTRCGEKRKQTLPMMDFFS